MGDREDNTWKIPRHVPTRSSNRATCPIIDLFGLIPDIHSKQMHLTKARGMHKMPIDVAKRSLSKAEENGINKH